MSNKKWRSFSTKVILVLFCLTVLICAFSFLNNEKFTGKNLAENTDISVGKTVFPGEMVLAEDEMVKVPLASNIDFIIPQFLDLNLRGILLSLSTGTVPIPINVVSSEGISSTGHAVGFEGPGYLTLDGDNLAVKGPSNFVWGYTSPYKVLTKTDSGVDLYENGTKIQSIEENDIKNQNFDNPNINTSDIVNWYNHHSELGSNYTLEKAIVNFSDNRSMIAPNDIKDYFGEDIYNYTDAYPIKTSVVVYMDNFSENSSTDFVTGLGSYPQYNNDMRAYNAALFCEGWNNTIIAPDSYGSGKSDVEFGVVSDGDAPSGSAAHGVCPPARTLRAATLNEGLELPIGMSMADEALMYGFKPCEDVKVYNDNDYPIKVVMWYEGSGTGMVLHAKIVKYVPN